MASTLNSVPAANSSSGNAVNSQNPGRPSLRSSASTKGDGRRQSGSPGDGGQRRTNSHKAWTQGTNPITQRSSHASSNGNMSRQSASPRPNQKESNTPENHAHDRLVFLFASFIGLNTTITTKNGDKYTGIFSSSTLEPSESSFSLKMVQRVSDDNQSKTNGVSQVASPYLGTGIDHAMAFDIRDVADISVPNVVPAEVSVKESNGTAGFRTDTDISGNLAVRERTLQRWEPAETDIHLSLDSGAGGSSGWDQFEANERLFGAKTNYDENIYTTVLDRSDPAFRQKQVEAARIAREIEGSDVDNPHMREERGLVAPATGDDDEEAKYSGVQRENKAFPPLLSGQPNKYTPPGRRQAGAPAPPAKQPVSATSTPTPAVPQAKEAKEQVAPVEKQQTSAPIKPSAEVEQKPVSANLPPAPLPTAAPAAKRSIPENATANVETEVLDHFRQFANNEKLKMQERRRNQASYDRTIKLNELMKFSKNFKLSTPVPKDLVPILAKDPHKQEAIIQRAHTQGDVKPPTKATAQAAEQKSAARAPVPTGPVTPAAPSDRQNFRGRPGYLPTGPLAGPSGRFPQQQMQPGRLGTGTLSGRLADNLQQRKGGIPMAPVSAPMPIQDARGPPTGPASDQPRVTSPVKSQTTLNISAASKFNVRAMEFKPNPAASTFTPGGPSTGAPAATPRAFSRNRSISRATTPSAFFGVRKPLPISERPSVDDQFNPIKRMKKEGGESTEKPFIFNGGIPPPYKTLPTWDVPEGNEEKTYDQMFKVPLTMPTVSPQGRAASNNPHLPQQHQMPFQFQQGNPGMPASSGPPNGPHVHHPGPHVDDHHHRMQLSASSSQVFPSPRMQQSHLGYPSPMAPPAQLAFGQPMPQFYGGPQPGGHMRHYQGSHGPQFVNPQMGAPMMVQQPSNGPYMGVPQGMSPYNPQMQMYSPSPGHAYPQHAPAQPHSGYPSPSRGAPMMMHQNSQSGQPPQPMMFMSPGQPGYGGQQPGHAPPGRGGYPQQQAHFSSSPHQAHHFPPNQHRAPGNNFNQVPQIPPQMASNTPANSGSGTHPGEATDEGK
ncbi:SM domain found in ataxin-2 [Penicillium herquei]|nr:SM domain found in ataxin-2 [Penicillium herquei]